MSWNDLADLFNQAQALYNGGEVEQAHAIFSQLSTNEPRNLNLLIWVAYTSRDIVTAEKALLQAQALNPDFPDLLAAVTWLNEQKQLSSDTQYQSPFGATFTGNKKKP